MKYTTFFSNFGPLIKPLIYSIDNSPKDAVLEFKYNDKLILDSNLKPLNPSKVCQGETCKANKKTYEIKKGQSYKIYINYQVDTVGKSDNYKGITYYLPSFSFHFIYEEEEIEEGEEEMEGEKEKIKKVLEKNKENEKSKQNEKNEDSNFFSGKNIIIFIILGILLIGGIVLSIFLIYRKKRNANIGESTGENFKFESELKYVDEI